MEIRVKTLNEDGSILFDGILRKHEIDFVLEVGVNFLLVNGATPYIQDEDEEIEDAMLGPSTTVQQ